MSALRHDICPVGAIGACPRIGTADRLVEHLRTAHGVGADLYPSADALDDLDDARSAVRLYEAGMWWGAFALAGCVALILIGAVGMAVVPLLAGATQTALVLGCVGAGLAVLFGMAWTIAEFEGGSSYDQRRRAQRVYDRAIRREGEQAAAS